MNPEDHCVFRLDRGKVIIILCVYVDDLLITSNSPNDIAHFNEFLRYKFKSITVNVGLIHSYLGMTLDFNPNNAVEVSMKGYIKQLLIDYNIQKLSPSPALLRTPCSINLMIKCYFQNQKTFDSILVSQNFFISPRESALIFN
jgi:hypothetical protein